jgi:Kef-type K+ transport system membrane component KefB
LESHAPVAAAYAPSGSLLGALALILAAAYVFAWLARRVRQPIVVGEIVAGIALGPSVLGLFPGDLVDLAFPADVRPCLQVLAQLGLVLFMFDVGYHFDSSRLKGHGRQVMAVSLSSVALPFALGAGLACATAPWFDRSAMTADGLLVPALFLGAAMSITAFPVLARIIGERGLQQDRIGAMALGCAAIQDFLAWTVLAVVVALANSTGAGPLLRMAVASVALLVGLHYVVRPALTWLFAPERRRAGSALTQAVLVVGLLLSAWTTEAIGLHAVFGAFAFGAIVPRARIDATAPQVPERLEQISLFLLPVFFIVTGLSVNLGGLGGPGLLLLLAVLLVACFGKFVGAASAARLTGATKREAATLGVLLNARGLTELVILNVGLALGVLDGRLFTGMVVMAVVTTIMTGPLLDRFHPTAGTPSVHSVEATRTCTAKSERGLVPSQDDTT